MRALALYLLPALGVVVPGGQSHCPHLPDLALRLGHVAASSLQGVLAVQHASQEPHPGFKRGAQSTALAASASVHPLDHAIEQARKLRSPSQKRMELGKLLARAGRWKELKEVLSTVASPHEAAEIAWWIKFELPGGAVE